MLARNNFRVALYKLILLKNIVDTKVHKERIQVLYAFEQLIINTEDLDEEGDYGREEDTQFIEGKVPLSQSQIQEILETESDPFLREQLQQLYNPLYKGMHDAEQYFQNSEDIINEEDYEESIDESRKQSPLKQLSKHEQSVTQPVKVEKQDSSTPNNQEVSKDLKKAEAKNDEALKN